MKSTEDKTCENCKFYLRHYIKKPTGFVKVSYGHCTYSRIINQSKKREDCKYWQPTETHENQLKERLTEYLKNLARRLDAVCEALLDDND